MTLSEISGGAIVGDRRAGSLLRRFWDIAAFVAILAFTAAALIAVALAAPIALGLAALGASLERRGASRRWRLAEAQL